MTAQWMVVPRAADLSRRFDPVRFWSKLIVIERHNVTGAKAGAWSVTGLNRGLAGLLTAGNGVILFRDGVKIMSGDIVSIARGATESTVSGWSDTACLDDRLIAPNPTQPWSAQANAYDNRSGPAETVLLGYINANAGPGALPARRVAGLRVPVSAGRGKTTTVKGRFDKLGTIAADVAESGGLHHDIIQGEDDLGPFLQTTVRPVADRSPNVRFGTAGSFTGAVVGRDWSYTLERPTVTRAVVAGGGEGAARILVERSDIAAEATWGRRTEQIVDQRQTTSSTELAQAGDDALADGANPVSVSFTVTDQPDVRYRRDWQVGDRVGVNIDGLDFTDVVREVTTTVGNQQGSPSETISAVVGSRDASKWTTKTNTKVAKALRAIDRLQAI
ncbi:siphovirus ReqiPepy6 Gp37-like family protein [Curtobacterium sp. MCBD17_026]|uniref:siphovirus ReqiPepy6 Gp37-like family protein n=1 Tax=Curtobacterium sp. MCBD17_026 TaxID=2175621 RepID=UPI0011B5BE32|nr:siphovirus ReqiPepy6 Gp37-like family protein [Curtobacterium sp. MCBD17_026]WIB69806.1 siphovirus ReqiPepy6 Gp37-like family protein [Curtobacterium sp. MCBD17_026]